MTEIKESYLKRVKPDTHTLVSVTVDTVGYSVNAATAEPASLREPISFYLMIIFRLLYLLEYIMILSK